MKTSFSFPKEKIVDITFNYQSLKTILSIKYRVNQ